MSHDKINEAVDLLNNQEQFLVINSTTHWLLKAWLDMKQGLNCLMPLKRAHDAEMQLIAQSKDTNHNRKCLAILLAYLVERGEGLQATSILRRLNVSVSQLDISLELQDRLLE